MKTNAANTYFRGPRVEESKPVRSPILRTAAGKVGEGAKVVFEKAASTAFDGAKWALKKCFVKALDVTAWVAKGAVIASVTATALTALGAAISPSMTVKVIDSLAQTLGAQARTASDVYTIGDVVIIQAKYTGELLALALKNGIELGAKSAVYTAQAIHNHIVVPMFQGFFGFFTSR